MTRRWREADSNFRSRSGTAGVIGSVAVTAKGPVLGAVAVFVEDLAESPFGAECRPQLRLAILAASVEMVEPLRRVAIES